MPVLVETVKKARKSHHCYNCGCQIAAGESYTYLSGVDEGSGWSAKTHTDCRQAEVFLNRHHEHRDWCDDWWELGEFLSEDREYLEAIKDKFPQVYERVISHQHSEG